ncbi:MULTISPECIES: ABC transporter ATP-binding protein [unclassified Bacillus (in: firmicutes)]|uniref:ABC transporter ATP-binding protein n=1 Tax=unclassified Bacillus (in: firmicutes) TaxID=185979 RepID=UPI000BF1D242|nr:MULTISPECIES: ABC transporter ATP-binding protein [unclassified Bacillus (in: firmicutes)]PEJ58312.1 multidrug ABC transporter ATP-binding protein [Bacillus sp. AFS002410]PEL08174.1 multidrug ABC transporter ATP-binding protein [Bacillus sp. AFS017336]PGS52011.1 multidrug ABC transporter ATP-binding protein [Bacillus sp. AFS041924]
MIQVKNVSKKFGRKNVLRDISFTANKGEITCLIGINGVGKSTTMKAIMGITPIDRGEILIDDKKMNHSMYENITFIPDTLTMLPSFTVGEAMQFMKDFYVNWNEERAKELLGFFRLKEDEKLGELSKGNAAKANLLFGLGLDVDYVLMDEPFSGIDMFSREQIAKVFTSHLIEDRGVIITTHEISDIEHLIDKVVLLDNGEILKEFYTEELRLEEGKSVMDVMREVYHS